MNTPFTEILHTNVAPSDVDCARIRELVLEPCEKLVQLDNEIALLQSSLGRLIEKRQELKAFVDSHLSLLSPARRLPSDVLAEIFKACLPPDRNAVMSGAQSPLLLCQICQAWRNLALSIPRLWTSLHIVLPEDTSKLSELNQSISAWLSKSGALPLSISVVCPKGRVDYSMVLETLVRYSPRWARMRFKVWAYSNSIFAALSPLSGADLPILHTLAFHCVCEAFLVDPGKFGTFLIIPTLVSMSLSGVPCPFPLPWKGLRHLCLARETVGTYFSGTRALDLLRQLPDLETCSLGIGVSAPVDGHPTASMSPLLPCRMENLWHLSVADPWCHSRDLFKNLDLPHLRSLEYAGSTQLEEPPFLPLLQFASPLQRLGLQAGAGAFDWAAHCLRLLPALRELCLHGDPFNTQVWASLTPTAQNHHDVLCPALRSVQFTGLTDLSDNSLLEFIRSRTESGFADIVPLTNVHVVFERGLQVDIVPALQESIANGLDLRLRYSSSPTYSSSRDNVGYSPERLSDDWLSEFETAIQ
ncbi:hypothetical protein C8R46DRAFT_1119488 [Mycena filopes]|nr:hypothetical protein C8R46DRAFT_1119488 [Mycena filopes]